MDFDELRAAHPEKNREILRMEIRYNDLQSLNELKEHAGFSVLTRWIVDKIDAIEDVLVNNVSISENERHRLHGSRAALCDILSMLDSLEREQEAIENKLKRL